MLAREGSSARDPPKSKCNTSALLFALVPSLSNSQYTPSASQSSVFLVLILTMTYLSKSSQKNDPERKDALARLFENFKHTQTHTDLYATLL